MSSNYNQDTTQDLINYLIANLDTPESVDLKKVQQLFVEGANPNGEDEHGNNVLELACQLENVDIVKESIARGADRTRVEPNQVDNQQIAGLLKGKVDKEMMDIARKLGESYFSELHSRQSQSKSRGQNSSRGGSIGF